MTRSVSTVVAIWFAVAIAACGSTVTNADADDVRLDSSDDMPQPPDVMSCTGGRLHCLGVCVDPLVDSSNCGACGNVCAAGQLCSRGACTCSIGLTACAGRCIDTQSSNANCGGCDNVCAAGHACRAGVCELTCEASFTDCGGVCANTQTDVANCGACAHACAPGEVCSMGSCAARCASGLTGCSGSCVDIATDPAHCGSCEAACATQANADSICLHGTCDFVCASGFHRCDAACVPDSDVATCGTSCSPCVPPAHGIATCESGSCGFTCAPGFVPSAGACVDAPPPRPVHPLSNSVVSVRAPMLEWSLPPEITIARITICADRACTTPVMTFDGSSGRGRLPSDLPRGVWYWNLRSVVGGAPSALVSATWQFRTPAVSGPVEWAFEGSSDLNGDGYDDFTFWSCATSSGRPAAYVYAGNAAGGVGEAHPVGNAISSMYLARPGQLGDVNGDGLVDLAIGYPSDAPHRIEIRGGEPGDSWSFPLIQSVDATPGGMPVALGYAGPTAIGDFDHDGYADGIVSQSGSSTAVWVAHGSPTGWSTFEPLVGPTGPVTSIAAMDVDADGYDDLFAMAPTLVWWHGGPLGLSGPLPLGPALNSSSYDLLLGVGDVDGDGYLDAVQMNVEYGLPSTNSVVLIRGSATGPILSPVQSSAPIGSDRQFEGPIGDIDGDGRVDLAVGYSSGSWVPRGFDAVFGSAMGYLPSALQHEAVPCEPQLAATRTIGDWNGDGIADGMALCIGGTAQLLLGNTSGAPTAVTITLPAPGGECGVQ